MKRSLPLPLLLLCLASGPALAQKSKPVPAGCKDDFGDCREDCTTDYGGSTRTYKQLTACFNECSEKMDVCRDRHYTALGSGLDPGALERPRAADPAMREPSRGVSNRDDLRDDEDERPSRPREKERPARASREERPAAASEPESEPGPAPARRDVYRAPQPEPKKAVVAEPSPEPEAPAYDDSADEGGSLPPPPPRAEVKPAALREPAPETKPAARVTESDPQDEAEPLPPPPPPKPKVEEPKPAPVVRPPPPPEPKKKDISEWDPNADE